MNMVVFEYSQSGRDQYPSSFWQADTRQLPLSHDTTVIVVFDKVTVPWMPFLFKKNKPSTIPVPIWPVSWPSPQQWNLDWYQCCTHCRKLARVWTKTIYTTRDTKPRGWKTRQNWNIFSSTIIHLRRIQN